MAKYPIHPETRDKVASEKCGPQSASPEYNRWLTEKYAGCTTEQVRMFRFAIKREAFGWLYSHTSRTEEPPNIVLELTELGEELSRREAIGYDLRRN